MLGWLLRAVGAPRFLATLALIFALPNPAHAIGWGPTDFLVMGAPNFPDRVGVFDLNFAFRDTC
jgi:hypothetical protein